MIFTLLFYAVVAAIVSFVLAYPVAAIMNTILAGFMIQTTVTFAVAWSMLLLVAAFSMIFWIPAFIIVLAANATEQDTKGKVHGK